MSDVINGVPRELLEQVAAEMQHDSYLYMLGRELRALLTAQPQAGDDPWTPSAADYDRSIHQNPDAKAWADLFVATFPGLADKHDLMLAWFSNAMMAMHDWIKSQASAAQNQCGECGFPNGAGPHCGYHGTAQSAPAGEREAFEAYLVQSGKCSSLRGAEDDWQGDDYYVHSHDWRVWQARAAWQRTQSAKTEAFKE